MSGMSGCGAAAWRRLPDDAKLREMAGWVSAGTHPRLGMGSNLRVLAELPEIVQSIMLALISRPLVVPDDYDTLQEACNRAVEMQTIVLRPGEHSLIMGRLQPTKVEKELHIVGQPGAFLVGGLHMGIGSSGSLKNVVIHGHLWVYDGLWEISGCGIFNRDQDAAAVVSNNAQAHFKQCDIGGVNHIRSHHGVIQYGNSMLCLEECEVYYCRLAVALGNKCRCFIVGCDLKDCDVVFACMQGDTGIHLEVSDCEIARSGVVWKDGRRPPNVISRGNTVSRESLGQLYWTAPSPWGQWGNFPQPSEMIADGDCVIGDEDQMFDQLTLQEVAGMHPEAFPMGMDMS